MNPSELLQLADDDLLEAIQRRTFDFFWLGGHPESGLAPDRCTVDTDGKDDLAAIGGSGFGIMALIVATERGWITRDAARNRLARMLAVLCAPNAIMAPFRIS